MARKQRLLEDRAADIYLDVEYGRATSGTISVVRSTGAALPTAVSGDAVTVDTVNTTAASGYDTATPRVIPLTSATGVVVGRKYMLTTAAGRATWVTVVAVDSNDITIADELEAGITPASGDTFVGTRLTFEIIAANTATRDLNYLATWTYEVAGDTYVERTLFDVVRSNLHNPCTVAGMRQWNPELMSRWDTLLDSEFRFTQRLSDCFWEVVDQLAARGNLARAIVDWGSVERVVYAKQLEKMAWGNFHPGDIDSERWIEIVEERYLKEFNIWLGSVDWYDQNDDQIAGAGEEERKVKTSRLRL